MFRLLKKRASHIQGKNAEEKAHDFLITQGLKPICRNYRCKQGELDLIMSENDTLVIIEVRYRQSAIYGSALESVTRTKQAHIIAATQHYLLQKHEVRAVRFDVVAFSGTEEINWIKNAFQL